MKKIFILPLFFVLLASAVQADIGLFAGFGSGDDVEFIQDSVTVKTIEDTEEIAFWVQALDDTPILIDVGLFDTNDNLIHSYDFQRRDTDGDFIRTYTIAPNHYENTGEYRVYVYIVEENDQTEFEDISWTLNVIDSNTPPELIVKHNNNVVTEGQELTTDSHDLAFEFDLSESLDIDGDELVYGVRYAREGEELPPFNSSFISTEITYIFNPTDKTDVTYNLEFKISDGEGGEDIQSAKVTYNPVVGDFNHDGVVNIDDFLMLAWSFGSSPGDLNWNEEIDLDNNGVIGFGDWLIFINNYGEETGLSLRFFLDETETYEKSIEENEVFDFRVEAVNANNIINPYLNFEFSVEAQVDPNYIGEVGDLEVTRNEAILTVNSGYDTVLHSLTETKFHITATATDGTNTIEKTFVVDVNDLNRQPGSFELGISPEGTIKEGDVVRIFVKEQSIDPDGDIIIDYIINDQRFESGNWQTDFNDAGTHTITVSANDGFGGEVTESITFTVEDSPTNEPPTLIVEEDGNVVTSATLKEKSTLVLDLEVTDPDDDVYPGEISLRLNEETVPSGLALSNGRITYTPEYDVVSHDDPKNLERTFNIEIVTDDGHPEGRSEHTFSITVEDTNQLPAVLGLPTKFSQEGYNKELIFNVFPTTDLDGDEVTVRLNNPPYDSIEFENNQLTWNVRRNQGRSEDYELNFIMSDNFGGESITVVNVNITDNMAPNWDDGLEPSDPVISMVIEKNNRNVEVDLDDSFDGQDYRQELDWRIDWGDGDDTGWVEGIKSSSRNDRKHTYSGEEESFTITATIRDQEGNEDSTFQIVQLEIGTSENQPPTINNIPPQQRLEGEDFRYQVVANDPETDPLTYDLGSNPLGMSISTTGLITWDNVVRGNYNNIVVIVSDNENPAVISSFDLVVSPPSVVIDNAPVVSDIPNQQKAFGVDFDDIILDSFVDDSTGGATVVTSDADIEWSWQRVDAQGNQIAGSIYVNRFFTNAGNQQVAEIRYDSGFSGGSETLRFIATDEAGQSNSDDALFTILDNNNPTLTITRDNTTVSNVITIDEEELLELVLTAENLDPGETPTFSASGLPTGATFVANTFRWTPTSSQGGITYDLTFIVTDGNGGSAEKTLRINVNDNLRPFLTKDKKEVHSLEVGSIIINGWETVKRGDIIDISIFARNRGNVRADDVKITLEVPQLGYYSRSDEFDIRKRSEDLRMFNVEIPRNFREDFAFVIVTVSDDRNEDREVMGFLIE